MASDGDYSIQFVGTVGDEFNFQRKRDDTSCSPIFLEVEDTDLEVDTFKKSNMSSLNWIKSSDDNFLVVNSEGQLLFEDLNKQQRCNSECKFTIYPYNSSQPVDGMAVMLVAIKGNEKKVVCCSQEGEIHAETLDVPIQVENSGHKALFFRKSVTGRRNTYRFQSSLCKSRYLGLKDDDDDPTLSRLVLRCSPTDEVDESSLFKVDQCKVSR